MKLIQIWYSAYKLGLGVGVGVGYGVGAVVGIGVSGICVGVDMMVGGETIRFYVRNF